MPNKALNKKRKDAYYRKAKEQNYRSRAAFKLLQLNQRFEFLNNSRAIVDLCAAPGGWLQVCRKHCAPTTKILGVDLTPIKRINGVDTFTGDITHRRTSQTIVHMLRGQKADVVLHDGAPNMGQSWIQDAYTQNELVLASVKLCTQILRKGGMFITKAFRSRDYASLQFILSKFFHRVESTKPPASRNSSAEIYFVCLGYIDPTHIDPDLLNPQSVFQESKKPKKSLKQYLKEAKKPKTRNRAGYDEDYTIFYKSTSVADFLLTQTPIHLFMEMYEIVFDLGGNNDALVKQVLSHPATTTEIKKLCEDLKVIGEYEFRKLMKYRKILRHDLKIEEKEEITEEDKNEILPPPGIPDLSAEQLEEELTGIQKRIARRERRTLEKTLVRRRGRMPHPDELFEDPNDVMDTYNDQSQGGLFTLSGVENTEDTFDVPLRELVPLYENEKKKQKEEDAKWKKELADSRKWLGNLNGEYDQSIEEDMTEYYESYEKERLLKQRNLDLLLTHDQDGNLALPEGLGLGFRKHAQKRQKRMDNQMQMEKNILYNAIQAERKENEDILMKRKKKGSSNKLILRLKDHAHEDSDSEEEDGEYYPKVEKNVKRWFSQSIFEDDMAKQKKLMDTPEEGDDDDDDNFDGDFEGLPKKKRKLSRDKSEDIRGGGGSMNALMLAGANLPKEKDGFEYPTDEVEEDNIPEEMYDENIGSVTLGLAKKLILDKNLREEWIDGSYNRYAHNDISGLPEWFQRDFNANTQRELPMTKEEVVEQRKKFKELNSQPIRKVAEVEYRKKRKRFLKKRSMISKANRIANEPDLPNSSKINKLQKLYNSFSGKDKRRKVYKTPGKGLKRKRGSKVVFVDNRLKADKRRGRTERNRNKK